MQFVADEAEDCRTQAFETYLKFTLARLAGLRCPSVVSGATAVHPHRLALASRLAHLYDGPLCRAVTSGTVE